MQCWELSYEERSTRMKATDALEAEDGIRILRLEHTTAARHCLSIFDPHCVIHQVCEHYIDAKRIFQYCRSPQPLPSASKTYAVQWRLIGLLWQRLANSLSGQTVFGVVLEDKIAGHWGTKRPYID